LGVRNPIRNDILGLGLGCLFNGGYMNREDIICMAKEAGLVGKPTYINGLEAFAALVASHALVEPCCGNYDQCQKVCMPRAASAEREACAKECEGINSAEDYYGERPELICAEAIRARGQA